MAQSQEPRFSAFFYGTLMKPWMLTWVIDNDGSHLQVRPAVLFVSDGFHHRGVVVCTTEVFSFDLSIAARITPGMKSRGFSGLLPYSTSKSMFDEELKPEERSVHGLLVIGLTEPDMEVLDDFEGEGERYTRTMVTVHPLGPTIPFPSYKPSEGSPSVSVSAEVGTLGPPVQCDAYIWSGPLEELTKEFWVP